MTFCSGYEKGSSKVQKPRIGRHQKKPPTISSDPKPIRQNQQKSTLADTRMGDAKLHAHIDYEDPYIQPLLLSALQSRLPPELLVLIKDLSELPSPSTPLLQWLQYENIDFDHLLQHPRSSLANSYIIRKALIRKHFLAATVEQWVAKRPQSLLGGCVKVGVEFEVDFAEFLGEALVEAWELGGSWGRNRALDESGGEVEGEREWWILKPGMSERGEGIRLFSSEEELTAIFEEWDGDSDDEEEEDENDALRTDDTNTHGLITSQLRHFVAQPYIHPPLLLPAPHPSAGRKFHIRTYVLASGALRVYVYKPMLALFAAKPYSPPSSANAADLSSHLTNTCLQSTGEREGSVQLFWDLPAHLPSLKHCWREDVFKQICAITGEVFEAAARSMSVHFQLLPNAFEVFGVDFLVDGVGGMWLLEVNAFPDFKQTGGELRGVVRGLFEGVVEVVVKPFFGVGRGEGKGEGEEGIEGEGEARMGLVEVLDIDLGRR